MNSKKGVTLASLVIYIVLFTAFTAFVSSVSGNLNENLLDSRGQAINYNNINKLEYNLNDSAINSNNVTFENNVITFSNGDVYAYEENSKVILKNGGVLLSNIEIDNIAITNTLDDESNIITKKLVLEVKLSKYLNELDKIIVCSVEVI